MNGLCAVCQALYLQASISVQCRLVHDWLSTRPGEDGCWLVKWLAALIFDTGTDCNLGRCLSRSAQHLLVIRCGSVF